MKNLSIKEIMNVFGGKTDYVMCLVHGKKTGVMGPGMNYEEKKEFCVKKMGGSIYVAGYTDNKGKLFLEGTEEGKREIMSTLEAEMKENL